MSEMLNQVSKFKDEMKGQAKAGEEAELPPGASPIEAAPADPPTEEPATEVEAAAPVAEAAPEKKLIRIGDQTFESEADAIKYAEKLENDRLYESAYHQGIKEALQHTQAPPVPAEPEEDFETEFYTRPKETILKVKEQAKAEMRAEIDAERRKESLWRTFEERYADVDRKDAELILAQNMDTIGKMTDVDKAMEALARRTRGEYQRIFERMQPRTALPPSKGQSVVAPSDAPRSVTPQKKDDTPLTMAQQMKKLREQKRNSPA